MQKLPLHRGDTTLWTMVGAQACPQKAKIALSPVIYVLSLSWNFSGL